MKHAYSMNINECIVKYITHLTHTQTHTHRHTRMPVCKSILYSGTLTACQRGDDQQEGLWLRVCVSAKYISARIKCINRLMVMFLGRKQPDGEKDVQCVPPCTLITENSAMASRN